MKRAIRLTAALLLRILFCKVSAPLFHIFIESSVFRKFLPQRAVCVGADEPQDVAGRDSGVHGGKKEPRNILDQIPMRHFCADLSAMEVDDVERRVG